MLGGHHDVIIVIGSVLLARRIVYGLVRVRRTRDK
jgi:hypothetical protein